MATEEDKDNQEAYAFTSRTNIRKDKRVTIVRLLPMMVTPPPTNWQDVRKTNSRP